MSTPADQFVDLIYETALHPERWQQVVEGISALFGGSPLSMGILVSGVPGLQPRYVVGLDDEGSVEFLERLVAMPQWSMKMFLGYGERFGDLNDGLEDVDPASTSLYTDWMKPRGLAPIWPAGHQLVGESGESLGGFFVFRREGEGPFTQRELDEASRFVAPLRRAVQTLARLGRAQDKRMALTQVLDRLATGVLLLDSQRRVAVLNQTARRIIDLDDGLVVDRAGLSASDSRENATLQGLIADALGPSLHAQPAPRSFATISRPSGRREFALMISPLRNPEVGSGPGDLSVAVFVVDPEGGVPPVAEVLEDLYSLTHSEAEIVRLMAAGLSLEDAARTRGISINTARSHLKHAFSKTRTNRQGELVRLILSGVGAFQEH